MARIAGKGTTLKCGSDTIVQVVSISGPGITVGTVDVTNLSSTFVEMEWTIADHGDVSFQAQLDPSDTTHAAMATWYATPSEKTCVVTLSNGYTITFDGFLTNYAISGLEAQSRVLVDITIRTTSAVVIAAGAGGGG